MATQEQNNLSELESMLPELEEKLLRDDLNRIKETIRDIKQDSLEITGSTMYAMNVCVSTNDHYLFNKESKELYQKAINLLKEKL